MARLPWRRVRAEQVPELTGVWARSVATSETVQRRIVALGSPAGEVGALLSRAVAAGAVVRAEVHASCAEGSAHRPDAGLQVPSDTRARALHDRVRTLVAAQRAALHRATLLTMPADPAEQAVLLTGLRRAVGDLEAAAGQPVAPCGNAEPAPTGQAPPLR